MTASGGGNLRADYSENGILSALFRTLISKEDGEIIFTINNRPAIVTHGARIQWSSTSLMNNNPFLLISAFLSNTYENSAAQFFNALSLVLFYMSMLTHMRCLTVEWLADAWVCRKSGMLSEIIYTIQRRPWGRKRPRC